MSGGESGMLEGWALWPGYWAWAVGLAAAFYAATRGVGGHLSRDWRDTVALWLMGAVEDTWPRHFGALFDRIFGARHLSWHCFIRSSIASLLAVGVLYLLFGPVLGLLTVRTTDGLALWQVLAIGAAAGLAQ